MPQTISVSNTAELHEALSNANGGDTIELAAGDYGRLVLNSRTDFDITFPSNVTIRSADPSDPAVFSGMQLVGAANLTFDGVIFDYTFAAGDPVFQLLVNVSDSQNITIQNSVIDGDLAQGVSAIDDGFGYGIGLVVEDSEGIRLIGNEVFNFYRGIAVDGTNDLEIIGNDVHSMRSDGFNIMQVTDALIENNYIHDFRGSPDSGDHADMIQFWTTGTDAPSTDIVIRGNRFDIGEGMETQSLFMRNELVDLGVAGSEMFYQNILIEDNVIVNGHLHGITVGETAGLIIRNNSVLHADGGTVDGLDSSVEIPTIRIATTSTSVEVSNNITSDISGWDNQSDWSLHNNVFVQDQDPRAEGYYGDVFIASSLDPVDGQHNFIALPGGMIDGSGAGAGVTGYQYASGQFHVRAVADNDAARVFDANLGGADLSTLPANTDFEWDFGDGTTATGRTVEHIYQSGGQYDITLTVHLQSGSTTVRTIPLDIAGAEVLSLDSDGRFVAYHSGIETTLGDPDTDAADGLQLGASGVETSVEHAHIVRILENNEFTISMMLDATSTASEGELFRIHGSLMASVNSDGEFDLQAWQVGGTRTRLVTDGVDLTDGNSHMIDIRVADGQMQVWIDGNMAVETGLPNALQVLGHTDLTFGNPWGQPNFAGNLTSFDITQSASDYEATNENNGNTVYGGDGDDRLSGGDGDDTLYGRDGTDTLIGGNGNDTLIGGETINDLRDMIYGGDGDDIIHGGYGNDELRGDAGNDIIQGGFGADTLIGGAGNDALTGSALSDTLFGGDGFDFINGGFGNDRLNGGADADTFYHLGVADHGRDWIQDYNAAEGDVLMWGGGAATADDFLVQRAETANAGAAGTQEVFVTHIPTGNLLWALVDGDAQAEINIQIAGQVFDLL